MKNIKTRMRCSVHRLPKDGTRFERSEDHAYDHAFEANENCERLYPMCRYSIYNVDFWDCDESDQILIVSSRKCRKLRACMHVRKVCHVANLMGNLPWNLIKVFLATSPFHGDFSAFYGLIERVIPRRNKSIFN